MRRLIRRIEKAVLDGYNFICNVWFFFDLGHGLRGAISKARDTLPR